MGTEFLSPYPYPWGFAYPRQTRFSVELFFSLMLAVSLVDCLHLHFIVLLCMFRNGTGVEITLWESHGNGNMGIRFKLGNGNGKEWELTAWINGREWECTNPFTVISNLHDIEASRLLLRVLKQQLMAQRSCSRGKRCAKRRTIK